MYRINTGYWNKAERQTYKNWRYDSKFEASYAMYLDSELKAKRIKSWERQVTLELRVNDRKVCTYRIDFIVKHNDGITEFIETKGYATPVWKLKWSLFEALYDKPGNKLTIEQQGRWNLKKFN